MFIHSCLETLRITDKFSPNAFSIAKIVNKSFEICNEFHNENSMQKKSTYVLSFLGNIMDFIH